MTARYLERFSSLVPALQSNKVVQRIEKLKNRGEIQTEAEYNAALQDVLSNLSTTEFRPLFEYAPINPILSSSEDFNDMMDLIRDDLEVLFIEINNIFAAIKAHEEIFKDRLLDDLYYVLKELEDSERSLAIIGNASNSFDEIFLNSFNGNKLLIDRSNIFANEILFDNRKDEDIPDEEFVFIDSEEQVATLPLATQEDIAFASASIKTADTTVTEKNIQLTDSDINNILDGDTSSGWAYNILVQNTLKDGAKLSLELDLGDKRKISYLNIHPVSDFPMFLEKIEYVNINNNLVDLPDTSLFETTLSTPIRVSFPDIIAKKIVLSLSQGSSVLFDYDDNQTDFTFDDLKRGGEARFNVPILSQPIQDTIQDPDFLDTIPIVGTVEESYSSYNQYVFAFKSISTGLSSYKNDGYFISKSYEKSRAGLIALESDEEIPVIFDEEASVFAEIASFEYTIIKKDFNANAELIDSKQFPVLPLNSSGIENERLHFSGTVKVIPTRFLAHKSDDTAVDVEVYRNNVLLTRGADWRFFDRANPVDNADSDISPGLTTTRIETMHSDDVVRTGIYTVNYIPRYISEPNEEVIENGITYLSSGATEHPTKKGIEDINSSQLFLKIAIRNNSRSSNRTPKLGAYRLLASSLDEDKYVRIT